MRDEFGFQVNEHLKPSGSNFAAQSRNFSEHKACDKYSY
jgi:hypothetical protein